MSNSPAFQFYAADYLADEKVQLMSLEEEGAYIRLLSYCWREGSIPADEDLLVRLCKGANKEVIRRVISAFKPSDKYAGRLTHQRLEDEREKQEKRRQFSSEGGKKGMENRWSRRKQIPKNQEFREADKSTDKSAYQSLITENNPSSSISSSEYISTTTTTNAGAHAEQSAIIPPCTLQQAIARGEVIGCPKDAVEAWWNNRDAVGWTFRGQPIRNWHSDLARWRDNWRANEHQRAQHGKGQTGRKSEAERDYERTGLKEHIELPRL